MRSPDLIIDQFKSSPLVPGKKPSDTHVIVAMSGGVDSSVTASLFRDCGYQVTGVTLKLYSDNAAKKQGACCAGIDIFDAKKVASSMGFHHYVFDYEEVFRKEVIEPFLADYLKGHTPVPCIRCNQKVKFRDLLRASKQLGGDVLATGHYARIMAGDQAPELHTGIDPKKDQSYFLFTTTKEQLSYISFPLGGLYKEETRNLANHYNLKVANKPDSQDICFVSSDYRDLIKKSSNLDYRGKIVHINGEILGEHEGIFNYTVGQRRGLGVAYSEPLYVTRLIPVTKEVIVGPLSSLELAESTIEEVNWLGGVLEPGLELEVKLRSSQIPMPAKLIDYDMKQSRARIALLKPCLKTSSGQACVFYSNTRVLGGGWIAAD